MVVFPSSQQRLRHVQRFLPKYVRKSGAGPKAQFSADAPVRSFPTGASHRLTADGERLFARRSPVISA
jgi:hypothetical protein